jgi:SPP1 gp7 family putative phage head morphogenesis protein
VERDYQKAIIQPLKTLNRSVGEYYTDIRFDDWQDDLSGVISALTALANRVFQPVIQRLPAFFSLTSRFNDKQWRLIVKGGTGVEIPESQAVIPGQTSIPVSSGVLGVDAYRAEPWLADMQANWIAENVRLIKSIPAEILDDMEGIIRRGVLNGFANSVIKEQIIARYSVSERRAKLIAIDQIGKANAALAQQRQKDVGLDGYFWRGALDSRERKWHVEREGQRFSWDKPPKDGHPGQPIRCRCYAEPDFSNSIFNTK